MLVVVKSKQHVSVDDVAAAVSLQQSVLPVFILLHLSSCAAISCQ
jgi:hypothetical protein